MSDLEVLNLRQAGSVADTINRKQYNTDSDAAADRKDLARRMANGIHIEKEITDAKVNGSGTGVGVGTGGVGVGHGRFKGDITRMAQIDFYEGMLYSDVKESVFQDCFRDLDSDNDVELSQEEIDDYKYYLQLQQENKRLNRELSHNDIKVDRAKTAAALFGCLGGFVGFLGTYMPLVHKFDTIVKKGNLIHNGNKLVGFSSTDKGCEKIFNALCDVESGLGANSTSVILKSILGIVAGAAVLGYGAYYLTSHSKSGKEARNKKLQLEQEIIKNEAEINSMSRYSHIYG